MRKAFSIVRATALEILSEPLTLLVMLATLVLTVLAPAFHYHQFGEATRMARDAGFSAALVGGCVLAVFGAIRTVRREVETGTLEMALARPVSHHTFALAKVLGVWLASVALSGIVFLTSLAIVEGAAVGGGIAERTGDIARIWGPSLAAGVSVIILPLAAAAALNRFAHFRFVLTSVALAAVLAGAAGVWSMIRDGALLSPYLVAAVPLAFLYAVLSSSAVAFAFHFRANAAAALTGLVAAVGLPFVGNYYLAGSLTNGGTVSWMQVLLAAGAAAPAVAAFLLIGCAVREDGSSRGFGS